MPKLMMLLTLIGAVAVHTEALADQRAERQRGKEVFQYWCAPCHAPGDRHPGTLSLRHKYQNAVPAALEQRTDLNAELVALFVRSGVATMPFFRKTEISDAELSALGMYLTSVKQIP
jgi:mono/diheme cytochrome c family protein